MGKDYSRCRSCKRPYTEEEWRIRREKKAAAITAAYEKRVAEGRTTGRKPKEFDVNQAKTLRSMGYSIRYVAKIMGVSTHLVHSRTKAPCAGRGGRQ